jgi:site-specific recombinase XerD
MRVGWPLTDAEVSLVSKSFRGTYGKRNKALFVLEHRTGFRSSELLSLIMDDVLLHERQRIWYHPLSGSGGTVYDELGCPSAA